MTTEHKDGESSATGRQQASNHSTGPAACPGQRQESAAPCGFSPGCSACQTNKTLSFSISFQKEAQEGIGQGHRVIPPVAGFASSIGFTAPDGPRWPPGRPKTANMAHHGGSRPPKWLQMAQDGAQDASKIVQGASKTAQETPKAPQGEPQEAKNLQKHMVSV